MQAVKMKHRESNKMADVHPKEVENFKKAGFYLVGEIKVNVSGDADEPKDEPAGGEQAEVEKTPTRRVGRPPKGGK